MKNSKIIDRLSVEKALYEKGYSMVCGIDEAGRGPLAGPVCAAAVVLPPGGIMIDGVADSKKLSEKKRDALFNVIIDTAQDYSIAFASVEEIEEINILNATMLAMKRAVDGLGEAPEYIIVDGNRLPDFNGIPAEAIIKGDDLSMSIAAASILAKVTRDRLMLTYAKEYTQYGFEKHKGYGTALHTSNILEYGECPIHRKSFLKKLKAKK